MRKTVLWMLAAMLVCLYAGAETLELSAADGELLGGARLLRVEGVTCVTGIEREGDGVQVSFSLGEAGFYDVTVRQKSLGGHKENHLLLDGAHVGSVAVEDGGFAEATVPRQWMDAGSHTLALSKSWGWVAVESFRVTPSAPLPEDLYDVPPVLCDPQAGEPARRVMHFLCDIYGKKIISGQYCDQGMYGMENAAIWRATGGDYPALLGLDFIEYSPSRAEHGSSSEAVEKAVEYWEKGGLITFCWHWNAPSRYIRGVWYKGFYTDEVSISLEKIMNGDDPEGYELLLRDIDVIAAQLGRLQDAGVPVLWRPLHEASGGWFWWGASGPESYIRLYRLLWDRLTNVHGLHHLIWVWNGQDAAWYPGDDVVDIIGEDIYPGEREYGSQSAGFLRCLSYTSARKMIILSENGCLPDPDLLFRDGTVWGSFATWGGEFVLKNAKYNQLSEQYTEASMVRKVYADPRVITRRTLPDLKQYPLP